MKNVFKFFGIIAIVAIIGFSLTACGDDGGGSKDPASTMVKWEQGGTNYELVYTGLSSGTSTYILSVGNDGFNVGTVTIDGKTYKFVPSSEVHSSSSTFTIDIDNTTKEVTTTAATIPVTGGNSSSTSLSAGTTNATITDNASGTAAGTNPFAGNWEDDGVKVSVSKNLTWSATAQGYKGNGSYAYIGNNAIVYDSDGSLFGYANIVSGVMKVTGGYNFVKK